MNKNMISRIAVAVVAIPAILWISYQGGLFLKNMVTGFAFIGIIEFLWQEKFRPKNLLFWFTILMTLISVELVSNHQIIPIIIFVLLTGMYLAIQKDEPSVLFHKYIRLVFGLLYCGFLFSYVYRLHSDYTSFYLNLEDSSAGGDWLLLLFGFLWIGDSAALFVGRAIGKHKLAPTVSPNKTVEGFIGGLLGAVIFGVIMYFGVFTWLEWYHLLGLAIGCSIFGQLGDLVESMWKRSLNIKDSSNIIPGHGGVLDRFDSLLFAAPFMYYYKLFFIFS